MHGRPLARSAALAACAVVLLCSCAVLTSCATPAYARPNTRLTVDDFDAMAEAMGQSLSRTLADRGPDSEPWVVSMQKVTNLSSDVVPEREQWSVMAQLRGAQPIEALWKTKNVRFVMPAERVVAMRADENSDEFQEPTFAADRAATHVMTGVFRSVTRGEPEGDVRTDLYSMTFEILDLRTNLPAWTDAFEFKRQAKGKLWD